MKFTISILTYGALEHTKACLQSVLENSGDHDYEIILTDNGSTDGTAEFFREFAAKNPRKTFIVTNTENKGFIDPNRYALEIASGEFFVMLNNDAKVPREWLDKLLSPFDRFPRAALSGPDGSCCELTPDFYGMPGRKIDYLEGSCLCGRTEILRRHGLFSDYLEFAYCLVPETPVLTYDLRWVPIGSLRTGDKIISVDENPLSFKANRAYREGVVEHISRRLAECFKITMEDGREVICSTDHKWLTKKPLPSNTPYTWRASTDLSPGFRICSSLSIWEEDLSKDAGWLAGIFDGEGYVTKGTEQARSFTIGFSQTEGLVLDRAKDILDRMGIPFKCYHNKTSPAGKRLYNIQILRRRHVMEALGRLRPIRLLSQASFAWQGRSMRSRSSRNDLAIVAIESMGKREVVTMEVDRKTFVANGMVSHNCEDCDLSLRMQELGYTIHRVPFRIQHARNVTAKNVPRIAEYQEANRQAMLRRWSAWRKARSFKYPIIVRRRASAGDVLLVSAVVKALAERCPRATILVETDFKGIFAGNPRVIRTNSQIPAIRGARVIDLDMAYENRPGCHIIKAYSDLAQVGPIELRTEFFSSQLSNKHASQTLGNGTWIAIHAGPTTWEGKNWSEEKWQQFTQHLSSVGWKILLVGNLGYEISCDLDMRGKTPRVHDLAGYLKACKLFCGVDSFPMHLAQAIGTPIVPLFGVTSPQFILTLGSRAYPVESDPDHEFTGIRHKITGATHVPVTSNPMDTIEVEQVLVSIRVAMNTPEVIAA